MTEEEYQALLKVSRQVGWRFHVALVLAHETGHRIGAIRKLIWSDIDFEGREVRWRAEHEKTGYEHRTLVTAQALAALQEARTMSRGTADAPVLPSPNHPLRFEPVAAACVVVQSRATRGDGAEARQKLALAQTQVRDRPDGTAAQGALQTRRLMPVGSAGIKQRESDRRVS